MLMLCFCLLLLSLHQVGGSSPACARRWRWQRTQLCPPPEAHPSAAALLQLPTEQQCIFACTSRLPKCKAAHFKDSVCSLAVNFSQLSLWSAAVGLGQCNSLLLAPVLLQLLAFFDFRESLEKAAGSASISSEPFDVTRDSSGLHFAGRMTSYLKLSIPGGLTALTDGDGERAVSFFMKVRRPYKSKSVFMKISSDSEENLSYIYENGGDLIFRYSQLGKQFTSASEFMQTDADPSGFFLGVAASNISGAFAFLNDRVYDFRVSSYSGQAVDSVIRLGYSSISDGDCLEGTIVCFGIAQWKLSAEQLARLALMCE